MELKDLSESQQELIQPLLRLKTDVSLDSLVVLRDVFHDLSEAYNTFASTIKDTEQKLQTCYNIASSGSLTPQACEALLMVRGNTPNVSNVILSATAEQPGVLSVMLSMLIFLNRVHDEAKKLSNTLDQSVVDPISTFSNEYLKTFGKDEKRAFRQDISGFIPKLQEFKRSPNYSHSNIRKYVDNVLKSHKELQDCLSYETQLGEHLNNNLNSIDPKLISKAKNRTVRAKVSLSNYIQELFTIAPQLKNIVNFKNADIDTLSQISKVSKKQLELPNKNTLINNDSNFNGTPLEYQKYFCDLEQRRLELYSNCLQHWLDNHVRYEKGIYSQLEILWNQVIKFSPNNDYQRFESYLTGKTVQEDSKHNRLWLLPEPGPINDYSKIKLNSFSESSTPMEQSDNEEMELENYKLDIDNKMERTIDSKDLATDLSSTTEPERCGPTLNTFDNIMVVELMQSPVNCASYARPEPKVIEQLNKEPLKIDKSLKKINKQNQLETTKMIQNNKDNKYKNDKLKTLPENSDLILSKERKHSEKELVNKQERSDKVGKKDEDKSKNVDNDVKTEEKKHKKSELKLESKYLGASVSNKQDNNNNDNNQLRSKNDNDNDNKISNKQLEMDDVKQTVLKELTEKVKTKPSIKEEKQKSTKYVSTVNNLVNVDKNILDQQNQNDKLKILPENTNSRSSRDTKLKLYTKTDAILSRPSSAKVKEKFYNFLNYEQGEIENPKILLISTRNRLDDHMLNLFNRCKNKNSGAKFDWISDEVDDIVKLLEDYDTYPFTHDYQNIENFKGHADINVPMLRYSLFDKYMDEKQWTLFSLEVLVLMHHYISSFVNHPCISENEGDLREYLLANLGILEQTLIKFRKTIEAFRARCDVSDFEYSILDVVLRPRDSFTNSSPNMAVHIMDVRYRILLMIDSFSKGDIVIHSEKLFVISEFYYWMYRQLHVVYIALVQKLSRVINLIPKHSNDLADRWFKCLTSTKPYEELCHGFKFEGEEKVTKLCNNVLFELLQSLGIVNTLKEFAALKFTKKSYSDPVNTVKTMLLDLLKKMVKVEELDQELSEYFQSDPMGIQEENEPPKYLHEDDFFVDLKFFNDDDISVLAEIRHRRVLCMRQCIPKNYKTKTGKFIARKLVENDLINQGGWNKYFTERVDPVKLSKSWGMEEPVVLTICSCLHKYLSCDDLPFSEFPQYFQTILFLCSFMQTGIMPNFNMLKSSVKNNDNNNFPNQIPLVAHSILAASSYWFSKIVNSESQVKVKNNDGDEPERDSVEFVTDNTDEFYKKLRISGTGIRERLYSMLNFKFKVTENVAKQLYVLLQMPGNLHCLPVGLGNLNSYLLFDIFRYKTGGIFTPEKLLPNYIYHDKSCIELITLSNLNGLSNSVNSQMRGMNLQKVYNKVHIFLSHLLNYQVPLTFSLDKQDSEWDFSLLTPSYTERTVSSALYLRFISATFKNEIFKCLCEYSRFINQDGLFYILSLFVMLFRVLYPRLSDHIPNLSLFETDEENDLYNMINIFRFIINKNAIQFTNECIERVRDTNDPSLDENSLLPLITDEILQMLRYQCTMSNNIWNGFVQYAEFSSLLANCAIFHLKNIYKKIKVDAGVLMPQLRRLMILQRELDSSYIVRSPINDPSLQEQRLLNCMFFNYKNSNHKFTGYIEFMKLIKENLMRALEHRFVGMTEMVDASIQRENWQSIGPGNLYSSGAVDLITVLKFSLKASFDLEPPVEWLILPFTNACESSLRSYYMGISNTYRLKLLYNIHSFLVSGEPPIPETENVTDKVDDKNNDVKTEDKKHKKSLWKRLKHTIGGKSPKTPSHTTMLAQLDNYTKIFQDKPVIEDLTKIANLEYISNQLTKVPEDIFGFYYSQIRMRDPEYEFLHNAIGTSLISDTEKFFFFEPHQLLQIPHSKSLSSLIFASQRILKRDSNQSIMDVITIVMWKIVFVDFKFQIFYNLYTPNIMEGYKVENIIEKFPQTIFLFIEKLPEQYIEFAYNNFFEAFIKSVFYVIRNMKNHDYKFNKTNIKILYHDVDCITKLLEKYSQDNIPLINNVKTYIRKLI